MKHSLSNVERIFEQCENVLVISFTTAMGAAKILEFWRREGGVRSSARNGLSHVVITTTTPAKAVRTPELSTTPEQSTTIQHEEHRN